MVMVVQTSFRVQPKLNNTNFWVWLVGVIITIKVKLSLPELANNWK